MPSRLTLQRIHRGRHQLSINCTIDDLSFTTSYWYGDVDLIALEEKFGRALLERIYFHIAAFEINKVGSLAPSELDLGPYARFCTPRFEALWKKIFHKVWAQWRYEHDRPEYEGPTVIGAQEHQPSKAGRIEPGPVGVLAFCGGGKDSLVTQQLLHRAGTAHSTFIYAHSIYGQSARQHALVDRLLDKLPPVPRHRQWIYDDFMDSPVTQLHPERGVKSLTAAETPSSIFGALPVMLAHGYTDLALGHEASANVGNLVWDKTGEDVNHQWGKSLEAERLLNEYIQEELLENARYYSLLQPIYDVLIFQLLNRDLDALPFTHSCNIDKPWCKRCPKCAYVWLGYQAHLPREAVDPIFGENLLDLDENQAFYQQMLGLADHTPFECIGQIEETRLAFELCRRKGHQGRAMKMFIEAFPNFDPGPCLQRYLSINRSLSTLPGSLEGPVLAQMEEAKLETSARLASLLDQPGENRTAS